MRHLSLIVTLSIREALSFTRFTDEDLRDQNACVSCHGGEQEAGLSLRLSAATALLL